MKYPTTLRVGTKVRSKINPFNVYRVMCEVVIEDGDDSVLVAPWRDYGSERYGDTMTVEAKTLF